MITASQVRVKMEAFAIIPQLDTPAAARIISRGTTAIVSILFLLRTFKNIYLIKSPTYIKLTMADGYILGAN